MKKTIFASVFALLLAGCGNAQKVDNTPVAALDLNRYLGDWYEIARFDHSFERGLDFCKANYALREDGKIAVTNTGIKEGKNKTSNGKAKTTDTPALLRVSFFGPFYSDYRVMLLDTLPFVLPALKLYKAYGFEEIARYNDSPMDTSIYMRLAL